MKALLIAVFVATSDILISTVGAYVLPARPECTMRRLRATTPARCQVALQEEQEEPAEAEETAEEAEARLIKERNLAAKADREAVRDKVNLAIPAIAALALAALVGFGGKDALGGIDVPSIDPLGNTPGREEALAIKARTRAKSEAKRKEMLEDFRAGAVSDEVTATTAAE